MIIKTEKELEELKNMITQDSNGNVIFENETPTEYPCLVKWIDESMMGHYFNDMDDSDDDLLDELEEEEEEEEDDFDDQSPNGFTKFSVIRFVYIYKSEIEELIK